MRKKSSRVRPSQYALLAVIFAMAIVGSYLYAFPGETTNSDAMESAGVAVETAEVNYFEGASGFLARPEAEGSYPGVVVIHEWWGLNDGIRDAAAKLASQGYVVLAVDLYGEVATTPERARELTSSLNKTKALENMRAAVAYLRDKEGASRMASLGWCFGGGQSMQLALSDEDLDATVIYYGSLVTDEAQLSSIEQPVLGIFGGEDRSINVSVVRQFDAALDNAGVENEIYIYDGVGHAFANPSGANYAPNETRDAWDKTLDFLDRHLRQPVSDSGASGTQLALNETERYFADQLRSRGTEKIGGMPIEGFTPGLYMQAFPGMTKADFDGVLAIGGVWRHDAAADELTFEPYEGGMATSADGTVSDDGMPILLRNLADRLGAAEAGGRMVDSLISSLE